MDIRNLTDNEAEALSKIVSDEYRIKLLTHYFEWGPGGHYGSYEAHCGRKYGVNEFRGSSAWRRVTCPFCLMKMQEGE